MIKKISEAFGLFASASTLICCALPALFVMVGAGAVFAGVIQAFPQLIWVSSHKGPVFFVAGALLFINWRLLKKQTEIPCDTNKQHACKSTKSMSRVIWFVSACMYCIGGFMAYGLPLIMRYGLMAY